MSQNFTARLTRHPIAFDRTQGAEARAALSGLPPELLPLIEGTAGCSPYLRDLMAREGDWLRAALAIAPETALA